MSIQPPNPAPFVGASTSFIGVNARIMYDPDWSPSKPFLTYWGGTAGAAFATITDARRSFGSYYADWRNWSAWY